MSSQGGAQLRPKGSTQATKPLGSRPEKALLGALSQVAPASSQSHTPAPRGASPPPPGAGFQRSAIDPELSAAKPSGRKDTQAPHQPLLSLLPMQEPRWALFWLRGPPRCEGTLPHLSTCPSTALLAPFPSPNSREPRTLGGVMLLPWRPMFHEGNRSNRCPAFSRHTPHPKRA